MLVSMVYAVVMDNTWIIIILRIIIDTQETEILLKIHAPQNRNYFAMMKWTFGSIGRKL